jgi:DNA-binding MarR family transcriptional regulator
MSESQEFKNLLFGLVKQAKRDIERRFTQANIVITPFEYGVLSILKHNPATLAEVAKKLGIRPPSALPYVDALEKKKIILRHTDSKDRRKVLLNLTNKGQKIVQSIMKEHPQDILNQSFRKLSSSKQQQLLSLLSELTQTLNKYE